MAVAPGYRFDRVATPSLNVSSSSHLWRCYGQVFYICNHGRPAEGCQAKLEKREKKTCSVWFTIQQSALNSVYFALTTKTAVSA